MRYTVPLPVLILLSISSLPGRQVFLYISVPDACLPPLRCDYAPYTAPARFACCLRTRCFSHYCCTCVSPFAFSRMLLLFCSLPFIWNIPVRDAQIFYAVVLPFALYADTPGSACTLRCSGRCFATAVLPFCLLPAAFSFRSSATATGQFLFSRLLQVPLLPHLPDSVPWITIFLFLHHFLLPSLRAVLILFCAGSLVLHHRMSFSLYIPADLDGMLFLTLLSVFSVSIRMDSVILFCLLHFLHLFYTYTCYYSLTTHSLFSGSTVGWFVYCSGLVL